jgi:hypothetical protein
VLAGAGAELGVGVFQVQYQRDPGEVQAGLQELGDTAEPSRLCWLYQRVPPLVPAGQSSPRRSYRRRVRGTGRPA